MKGQQQSRTATGNFVHNDRKLFHCDLLNRDKPRTAIRQSLNSAASSSDPDLMI